MASGTTASLHRKSSSSVARVLNSLLSFCFAGNALSVKNHGTPLPSPQDLSKKESYNPKSGFKKLSRKLQTKCTVQTNRDEIVPAVLAGAAAMVIARYQKSSRLGCGGEMKKEGCCTPSEMGSVNVFLTSILPFQTSRKIQ